jgi:hypothetical protein
VVEQSADDAGRTVDVHKLDMGAKQRISDGPCHDAAWALLLSERSYRSEVEAGPVRPGQSRCQLTAEVPVAVFPEPYPVSPDPDDDHNSGTAAESGLCRLAGAWPGGGPD